MAAYHLLIDFSDRTDSELASDAAHIIASLTGNANFPAPYPSLADVQVKLDAYNDARSRLPNGTPEQTALKNQARAALVATLQQLAGYLDSQAGGDIAKLLGTGFRVSKDGHPYGVLPVVENVKLKTKDQTSVLHVTFDKVAGASSYIIEYCPAPLGPAPAWTTQVVVKTRNTIMKLTSGQRYAVRVAAVGADATRTFSDVVESYVL